MERCKTFHDYYLTGVYTLFALTVTNRLFRFIPLCSLENLNGEGTED